MNDVTGIFVCLTRTFHAPSHFKQNDNTGNTVKPRFNGLMIMRKCNCPLFEKTQILPSVDAHYMFWLKSLCYCYVAETYCT